MIRHIPNALTLANLFAGCLAVVCLFQDALRMVPWFIGLAIFFDYIDGFVARLLKVQSPTGKELDSLADMVSFGFVPGAILFKLIAASMGIENLPPEEYLSQPALWFAFSGFLVTLFSALRLAKFNLDQRQSDGFIGLPTPSSTLFVMGILLILLYGPYNLRPWILDSFTLALISAVLSFLLVAELPMFSLKFKHFGWKGNEERYLAIAIGVAMLVVLRHAAFAPLILLFVLYSGVRYALQKFS